jgi:hypothetical protein
MLSKPVDGIGPPLRGLGFDIGGIGDLIQDKDEQWDTMPPGDKQAWLLDPALDRKREILTIPLPDVADDSSEATRLRALILAAADSTISQTIALRSNALTSAQDTRDNELLQLIEERRQEALVQIAKMREEPGPAHRR